MITDKEFLALVYSDLFDFPLTKGEMNEWQINNKANKINKSNKINKKGDYFFLQGRNKIVDIRRERKELSENKKELALKGSKILERIATIEAIFLTGSLAMNNAKQDADVDLMIVTSTNMLWQTRLKVINCLKKLKLYRQKNKISDQICTNIFLDIFHLEVKNKNLFTAHEVLQAQCLYDKGGVCKKWLRENEWVREYLPTAYLLSLRESASWRRRSNLVSITRLPLPLGGIAMTIVEIFAFAAQYLYMFPKMSKEKVGWGYAFFHPRDLSEEIVKKFEQRLLQLSR